MKSAEEWAKEIIADRAEERFPTCESFARAIQADALRGAAAVCLNSGDNSGEWGSACRSCHDEILSLIPKEPT